MAELKYNLNSIWKGFSSTGNETLSLSVYQGTPSFVVFKKGTESRRPPVKMNLNLEACIKIADILKSLLDAQPETRSPFVQMQFNTESRSYEQATSFVFFKDDKRCYGVEISNKFLSTPIRVMFKSPNTFSTGGEALTDEQKSILGLRALITILTVQVPEAMLLSRFNMEPMANRRGGGNGGGNRGGMGGGYNNNRPSRDPYGHSGGSEEDVFG